MTLLTGLLIGINIGAVIGWRACKKFKGDFFALLSYLDMLGRGRETMKVRIKRGTPVAQDLMVGNWPATRAGTAADPDMEFDAEWNGTFWDCRAWGYGKMTSGVPGAYGNGSIFAFGKDGVEVLQ